MTGDVSHSDNVRFAPSPELVGQVVLRAPSSGDNENIIAPSSSHRPDMQSPTSDQPFPPNHNLRLKVAVNKSGYLELSLTGRHLRDIPAEAFNFVRLEALRVGNNRLRAIPSSIGQLRKLKILHVQQNAIVVLPDTIANCAHLTEVDLSTNHLSTLPETFFQLKYMRMLHLGHNQFESVPHLMGDMHTLWYLNLSANKLWHLPLSLQGLQNLHHLDLSKNLFDQLPICICHMLNLETLSLKHNKLINLPTDAEELVNLRELNMSHNKLESLPLVISNLKSLQVLDISHNKISNLPARLTKMHTLQNLKANNNRICTLPGNMESLQILDISHNCMTNFSVAKMKNLTQLIGGHNRIENLPLGICNLPELQVLSLDHNEINYVSQDIALLQRLHTLDLSYNKLNSLPQVITELERLENFNVRGNKIDPRLAYLPHARQKTKPTTDHNAATNQSKNKTSKPSLNQDAHTPMPKKKRFGGWFRARSQSQEREVLPPHSRSTAKSVSRARSRPPLDYEPKSHSLPSFFSPPMSRRSVTTRDATIAETNIAKVSTVRDKSTTRISTLPDSFEPAETFKSSHSGALSRTHTGNNMASAYTKAWIAGRNKDQQPASIRSTAVTINDSVGDSLSLGDYDFDLHPPQVRCDRLLGVVSEVENLFNKQIMSPVENRKTSLRKSVQSNATLRTQNSFMVDPYETDLSESYPHSQSQLMRPSTGTSITFQDDYIDNADDIKTKPPEDDNYLLRTRMDIFQVTPSGGLFRSTLDPNISVYFPVQAVDQPLTIKMQIEQVDETAVEQVKRGDSDLSNILSVGHIVHLHQNKNVNFLEQVILTIPEPPQKRRGHLQVINYKDDNTCSPCTSMFKSYKGYITLQAWHLTGKVAVLTRSKSKDKACNTMERLLNHLYL